MPLLPRVVFAAALTSAAAAVAAAETPVGTAFTYQGRVADAGAPANGTYDIQLVLWDADIGGTQVGSTVVKEDVVVTAGLFTVEVDFGAAALSAARRFVEVGLRPGASTGAFVVLSPRHELTPAPSAIFAQTAPWVGITGKPPGFADDIDNDALGGLSCSSGQVAKWDGAAWGCAADAHTTYTAGGGLVLTASTFSLDPSGCATGFVLKWNGGGWTCSPDIDTNSGGDITAVNTAAGSGLTGGVTAGSASLAVIFSGSGTATTVARSDHGHAGVYQPLITGTCPSGVISTINADGTVICASAVDPQPGFSTATLDSVTNVGTHNSITTGADGLGLISYYDNQFPNLHLKVAHCSNVPCTSASSRIVETGGGSAGDVGRFSSITIGADGFGLMSYYDGTNLDLKVAHCADAACTTASVATIDTGGIANVGQYTSITIGTDGLGLISYHDVTNGDLKVAHCSNVACSSATTVTVDATAGFVVGLFTSITIGTDGLGLISYRDDTNGNLRVAHCSDAACSAATISAIDPGGVDVGRYTSVAIGADGFGLVSYHDTTNGDLKVAHCSNVLCNAATLSAIDVTGTVGAYTSLTMGGDGLGMISYQDVTNGDLKVAHCSNLACTSAVVSTLDGAAAVVGSYTSMTVSADGLGLVSYFDSTNGDLKTAHCSNALCTPYVRRR
jgi:hypothetical protein